MLSDVSHFRVICFNRICLYVVQALYDPNVNTGGLNTSVPQVHHSTAAMLTFFNLLLRQRARKVRIVWSPRCSEWLEKERKRFSNKAGVAT